MRTAVQIARHVIKNTDDTKPRNLAAMCLREASADELAGFFDYAIREALATAAADTRRATQPELHRATLDGNEVRVASKRILAQRVAWSEYKRTRVSIGGEWRLLGTLNADELRTLAKERDRQASELTAKRDEYLRLSDAVERAGVETVADLADSLVAEAVAA